MSNFTDFFPSSGGAGGVNSYSVFSVSDGTSGLPVTEGYNSSTGIYEHPVGGVYLQTGFTAVQGTDYPNATVQDIRNNTELIREVAASSGGINTSPNGIGITNLRARSLWNPDNQTLYVNDFQASDGRVPFPLFPILRNANGTWTSQSTIQIPIINGATIIALGYNSNNGVYVGFFRVADTQFQAQYSTDLVTWTSYAVNYPWQNNSGGLSFGRTGSSVNQRMPTIWNDGDSMNLRMITSGGTSIYVRLDCSFSQTAAIPASNFSYAERQPNRVIAPFVNFGTPTFFGGSAGSEKSGGVPFAYDGTNWYTVRNINGSGGVIQRSSVFGTASSYVDYITDNTAGLIISSLQAISTTELVGVAQPGSGAPFGLLKFSTTASNIIGDGAARTFTPTGAGLNAALTQTVFLQIG